MVLWQVFLLDGHLPCNTDTEDQWSPSGRDPAEHAGLSPRPVPAAHTAVSLPRPPAAMSHQEGLSWDLAGATARSAPHEVLGEKAAILSGPWELSTAHPKIGHFEQEANENQQMRKRPSQSCPLTERVRIEGCRGPSPRGCSVKKSAAQDSPARTNLTALPPRACSPQPAALGSLKPLPLSGHFSGCGLLLCPSPATSLRSWSGRCLLPATTCGREETIPSSRCYRPCRRTSGGESNVTSLMGFHLVPKTQPDDLRPPDPGRPTHEAQMGFGWQHAYRKAIPRQRAGPGELGRRTGSHRHCRQPPTPCWWSHHFRPSHSPTEGTSHFQATKQPWAGPWDHPTRARR